MRNNQKWAIITGASSGIGKALSLEFAENGFNVFLTGRSKIELEKAALECSNRFRVATEILPADLSNPEDVERLIKKLKVNARHYEILANNAGFGIHGNFTSTSIEQEIKLVQLQIGATLKLTKAVLPSMKMRRSGRILNVASVYSFASVPLQSVYAACKAFILSFSSTISNELEGTGVTVTVLCPGITQTEFQSRAGIRDKNKNLGMSPKEVARIACRKTLQGKRIVIPGIVNKVFIMASRLIPAIIFTNIIKSINRLRGHRQQNERQK